MLSPACDEAAAPSAIRPTTNAVVSAVFMAWPMLLQVPLKPHLAILIFAVSVFLSHSTNSCDAARSY